VDDRHILSVFCMRLPGSARAANGPSAQETGPYTLRLLLPAVLYRGRGTEERDPPAPFFRGLLFEAGQDSRGGLVSPRLLGMSGPATRKGWEQALGWMFRPACNIGAALAASRRLPAGSELDIWLALPYPPGNQKQVFGLVNGCRIRFCSTPEHRLTALLWWVEEALARWNKLAAAVPGNRGTFRGFVWLKNYLDPDDVRLVNRLADALASRGCRLLWCCNYGTTYAHRRDAVRVDGVYTRPTWFGFGKRNGEWVRTAAAFSAEHGLGMVIWVPDGSPDGLKRWLAMGKAHMAGSPHLFELGDWRRSGLMDPGADVYHELFAYLREIGRGLP